MSPNETLGGAEGAPEMELDERLKRELQRRIEMLEHTRGPKLEGVADILVPISVPRDIQFEVHLSAELIKDLKTAMSNVQNNDQLAVIESAIEVAESIELSAEAADIARAEIESEGGNSAPALLMTGAVKRATSEIRKVKVNQILTEAGLLG